MKKLATILLFAACAATTAWAQEVEMHVTIKDAITITTDDGDVTLSGELVLPKDAFSSIRFDYKPIEGLDSVDLGLSVKWATINYKATAPYEEDDLVPWSEDDVVAKMWGIPYGWKWRTPTSEEMQELIDNCGWERGEVDGKKGYWVYNSEDAEFPSDERRQIFLPVTGYKNNGTLYAPNTKGYYWSSTKYDNQKSFSLILEPADEDMPKGYLDDQSIAYLMAIRPVWGDPKVTATPTLGAVTALLYSAEIEISYTTDDESAIRSYGVAYSVDGSSWTRISANNNTAKLTNLQPATTYSYKGYVELTTGSICETDIETFTTIRRTLSLAEVSASATSSSEATITFTINSNDAANVTFGVTYAIKEDWDDATKRTSVTPQGNIGTALTVPLQGLEADTTYTYQVWARCADLEETSIGTFDTPVSSKYKIPSSPVDLGLSVKWAPFNIGAEKETDYGGYFGWGDTTGELTAYTAGQYGGTCRAMHIGGNPDYDIAAAQWKGHWRLPTPDEVQELLKCNPKSTTKNGVKGWSFSNNGNSIFIPLAGIREGTEYAHVDTYAYVWTDSITPGYTGVCFQIMTSKVTPSESNKAHGMSVRPVWDDGTRPEPAKDLTREIVEGSDQDDRTGIIPQDGVDMGTNVKWARWNVGAKKKTGDTGRYYAWGDTIQRASYSYDDYMSPYKDVPAVDNGFLDIDDEQDVANKLWGNGWRMPTESDYNNLISNCEVDPDGSEGNLKGFILTSRTTGESLFFPACGYQAGTSVTNKNIEGRYWNKSVWVTSDADKKKGWASTFYFYKDIVTQPQISGLERYWGMPVRAVRDK